MAVYVRLDDVRALLKLVGEAREILDGGECARTHVIQGLSRLAGAAVGISMNMGELSADGPARVTDYLDHGWTADERGRVLAYYGAKEGARDPMIGGVLRSHRPEPHATYRRGDLVANDVWYGSALHNEIHRPARLGDVLLSVRFLAGNTVNALVFKRAATDPPFSVEERELLHMFRAESDWIFRPSVSTGSPVGAPSSTGSPSASPLDLAGGLTRREQDILSLLFTDASEKEVAARLGISPHTVHDYVKRLYRKLGVTSRAALMAAGAADRLGCASAGARGFPSSPGGAGERGARRARG